MNQVNDIYLTIGEKMVAYLEKVDALAKLALMRDTNLLDPVSMGFLAKPSIHSQPRII